MPLLANFLRRSLLEILVQKKSVFFAKHVTAYQNLQSVSPTGTIFFNKGVLIHNVPNHSMPFQFTQEQLFQTTLINTLMKFVIWYFQCEWPNKVEGRGTCSIRKHQETSM